MSRTHHARGVSKHRRSRWKHWFVRRTKPLERTLLDRPADARDDIDPYEIDFGDLDDYLDDYEFMPVSRGSRLRVSFLEAVKITW